jgi:RimJ/RimL family protein N-acetyltransferase
VVADAETDRCLGMVNYHDGHIRNKRVAIGYIINPARHRQRIATEAVSAMLDHCFGELGLHRVQAFIQPDNGASRALAEKLGFRCEGLLRDNLGWGTPGVTKCCMRSSEPTASARPDFTLSRLVPREDGARKPRYPDQRCVLAQA